MNVRHSHVTVVVGRRLLAVIPTLFGVSLLAFFALTVLPGNSAEQLLGVGATPKQVAQLEAALNLNEPAWKRYVKWLRDLSRGGLGRSLASGQRVKALLKERLPVTCELVAYAFLLSIGLAVPVALLAARWPNGPADRISTAVSMVGLSTPSYLLALVLVLVFSIHLKMFPSIGFAPLHEGVWENFRSLAMPALSIALPLLSLYARFLRSDVVEQIQGEDYVVAAIAKGIGPWRVLLRHALRNSLFGLITIIGLNVGTLIGGTVIIEQIFALPGIGQLLLQAINVRDVVVVQAIVLLLALVTVLANLGVDLAYALLDPRIRYSDA